MYQDLNPPRGKATKIACSTFGLEIMTWRESSKHIEKSHRNKDLARGVAIGQMRPEGWKGKGKP